jgi:predicted metal-binding protein
MTLRIERSTRERFTVFTLNGGMEAAQIPELKELFATETSLDLGDVRLADRDAVRFLRGCEADGMKLENCPAYVREWMDREKD